MFYKIILTFTFLEHPFKVSLCPPPFFFFFLNPSLVPGLTQQEL